VEGGAVGRLEGGGVGNIDGGSEESLVGTALPSWCSKSHLRDSPSNVRTKYLRNVLPSHPLPDPLPNVTETPGWYLPSSAYTWDRVTSTSSPAAYVRVPRTSSVGPQWNTTSASYRECPPMYPGCNSKEYAVVAERDCWLHWARQFVRPHEATKREARDRRRSRTDNRDVQGSGSGKGCTSRRNRRGRALAPPRWAGRRR